MSERDKKPWGLDKQREGSRRKSGAQGRKDHDDKRPVVDHSPEADALRLAYANDFKKFYDDIIAQTHKNRRSGLEVKQTLGKIHDLLIDFMTFEMAGLVRYSKLASYLPQKTSQGEDALEMYPERWLYWPTIESEPQIQDGADGPISRMFYEGTEIWLGVVMRIKGDGQIKSILMPRGHLKSAVCTQAMGLWRIIRDPSERTLIKSLTCELAKGFIKDIKYHFEMNERFRKYYGELLPNKREEAWNTAMLQVRMTQDRRGRDPTVWAQGTESETTGGHFDNVVMDDIVGKTNTRSVALRAETRAQVSLLQGAVLEPDSPMFDIGTRWEEDDAHSSFIAKDSDASFIVATVLDSENKPLWPEKFNMRAIAVKRRAMPDDRSWYGQFYNQFTGTGARTFHPDWRRYYEGTPEDAARGQRLDIKIGVDTASGIEEKKGNLDYTGMLVLGQTPDRTRCYVLDGIREKLPSHEMANTIIDMALKWQKIAAGYGGTFECGVEQNVYTQHLQTLLQYAQRARGVESIFSIRGLPIKKVDKGERIRGLARPYSDGVFMWPRTLVKAPVDLSESYDLIPLLDDEFTKYPSVQHDDLLDAHQMAWALTNPQDWKAGNFTPQQANHDPSIFTREMATAQQDQGEAMGGYERPAPGGSIWR